MPGIGGAGACVAQEGVAEGDSVAVDSVRVARMIGRGDPWKTDFSKISVPPSEIVSGGPPKDGIPSIDDPRFVSADEADSWLEPSEPVMVVEMDGETKAYPLRILMQHEIVNDRVGEAIVGDYVGTELELLAANTFSWEMSKELYPGLRVLSRDTGFDRDYGRNPYVGYDSRGGPIASFFPSSAEEDGRLPAMDRVAAGRDVGQTAAYGRNLGGRTLTFTWTGEVFRDEETGSTWSLAGRATSGPLEGRELEPVPHGDFFRFAWVGFRPDAELWKLPEPGG